MFVAVFLGEIEFKVVACHYLVASGGGSGDIGGVIVIAVADEDAFDFGSKHYGDGIFVTVTDACGEEFVVTQASGDFEVCDAEVASD